MIRWEDAVAGVTYGIPGTYLVGYPEFEVVPKEDGWIGVRVEPALLLELVRTPGYISWQGESWQFHCGRPMVYLGAWDEEDFARHAPDGDARALFERIVDHANWDYRDAVVVYVFRCAVCQALTAYWDCT